MYKPEQTCSPSMHIASPSSFVLCSIIWLGELNAAPHLFALYFISKRTCKDSKSTLSALFCLAPPKRASAMHLNTYGLKNHLPTNLINPVLSKLTTLRYTQHRLNKMRCAIDSSGATQSAFDSHHPAHLWIDAWDSTHHHHLQDGCI